MNKIQQKIEDRYQKISTSIDHDMLFGVLQSVYGKIITTSFRGPILHYIAASLIMKETGKLKTNVSNDGMYISVEGVDDIYTVAIEYLEGLDDEMRRITVNNTSSFSDTISMIQSISGDFQVEDEKYGMEEDGNYIDRVDLNAEETTQNLKEMIQEGAGKGSIFRKVEKLSLMYPFHWELYEINYHLTSDIKILEKGFVKLRKKIFDECNGDWPKKIEWGFTDNRPLLNFLKVYGSGLWQDGKHKEAITILQLLLHLNDNDNQGNRYDLLAIKEGLGLEELIEKFDRGGYFDSDIDDWFEEKKVKYKETKNL